MSVKWDIEENKNIRELPPSGGSTVSRILRRGTRHRVQTDEAITARHRVQR